MFRTQIYLQDSLHAHLKLQAHNIGVSLSELIRRTLERDIEKNPHLDAQNYFTRLNPLDSFANVQPDAYVRQLRSTSRMLRHPDVEDYGTEKTVAKKVIKKTAKPKATSRKKASAPND